ncbi:MAG: hypothetical protein HPPSJP_4950 [Candidatus Hepatoplasma scabrum]|nr:MAG: hypothetical protein HPPSJP_4950 [Candidatus Hepatoplasma sp.]
MEKIIKEEDLILEFNEICSTEKNIKDLKNILLFKQKFPLKKEWYESINLNFVRNFIKNYGVETEYESRKWFFEYFNNPFSRNPYITFTFNPEQRKILINTLNKLQKSLENKEENELK